MKCVPSTVACTSVSPHGQLLQLVCGKTISSDANIMMSENKQMKSERFSILDHLSGTCLNAPTGFDSQLPMQAQNQFKISLQTSQWFINFGLLCKRAAKTLSHEKDQSCDQFITNKTTKKRVHEEQNVKSINTNCVSFFKKFTNAKLLAIRIRGHSQNVHKWRLFFAKVRKINDVSLEWQWQKWRDDGTFVGSDVHRKWDSVKKSLLWWHPCWHWHWHWCWSRGRGRDQDRMVVPDSCWCWWR